MKKKFVPLLLLSALSLVGCSSTNAKAKLLEPGGNIYNNVGNYYYCGVTFTATKAAHFHIYASDFNYYDGETKVKGSVICTRSDLTFRQTGVIFLVNSSSLAVSFDLAKGDQQEVYVLFESCPPETLTSVNYYDTSITTTETAVSFYSGTN